MSSHLADETHTTLSRTGHALQHHTSRCRNMCCLTRLVNWTHIMLGPHDCCQHQTTKYPSPQHPLYSHHAHTCCRGPACFILAWLLPLKARLSSPNRSLMRQPNPAKGQAAACCSYNTAGPDPLQDTARLAEPQQPFQEYVLPTCCLHETWAA
jgi:hypothetical protein